MSDFSAGLTLGIAIGCAIALVVIVGLSFWDRR